MFIRSKLLINLSSLSFKNRAASRNIYRYSTNQNKWIPGAQSLNNGDNLDEISENSPPNGEKTTKYTRNTLQNDRPPQYNNFPQSTVSETDGDYVVRLKNDPDIFGSSQEPEIFNESDLVEEKHFTEQVSRTKKLSTKQYSDIIKQFIRKRKIKEAIDVVEVQMLKEDKVKPENYIYNLLIGACGRVGYTKKAFSLYNVMKKRGLQITGGTYTGLFNACSNSPWPLTDGLTRARHLYDIMVEKGYQPNDTNYNAMIKAFGKCGVLPLAFSLVDEMSKNGLVIKDDTINFLLQACISDKESGFRHSLLVWRKLVEKNITPSLYTFNLMLRSIRDCGLGDIEVTKDVITKIVGVNKPLEIQPAEQILISDPHELDEVEKLADETTRNTTSAKSLSPSSSPSDDVTRPNLMAQTPHLGNILSLSEVTKAEDRLLLVGGPSGFLETMKYYKCTPDIKTFTQLLDSIPSTTASEKELIVAMRKFNVKPDIDFFNMLIKKRSMRCDYEGAKEVLVSIKQRKYRPDLVTYGVLALGCRNKEEALELIQEMKNASYRLNSEILGAMLHQACYQYNFGYIFEIMELCISENIPVNNKFLSHLEKFEKDCNEKIRKKELIQHKEKSFGIFKARYKIWLDQVQKDETEDAHPWQQFRQELQDDVKYNEKGIARFKPRRASRFKVKTSTKKRY